jgi:hypothetical protein
VLVIAALVVLAAVSIEGQIYKFYSPGTIWTVTAVDMKGGMDQAYLEYLDGVFKRAHEAQVKAGFMKSYKILRTLDDDSSAWNLLILREYESLAAMEASAEKSDALDRQLLGDDQQQMKTWLDRDRIREVIWTKTARELRLR